MHDPDLETDSVPIYEPSKFHMAEKQFSKELTKNNRSMKDEDRFDSGCHLDSGFHSSRNESLQSFNLGSETNKYGLINEVEKFIPVSDIRNLSIESNADPDEGCDMKSDLTDTVGEDRTSVESESKQNDIKQTFRQDDDGDTLLHTAIIQLLEDLALYYIQLAPNPNYLNISNNYLQTPLHLAVITKQPQIARKLIISGALVDARDHKGNSPLHIASNEGYELAAKVLLEPLQLEELSGYSNQLSYQQLPQNLEGRNYNGQACVHLAAKGCHLETLKVLLNNGADINARDGKSGRTILHYAAESASMPLLKLLLKYPTIDLNAVTYGGLTAVTLAKGWGHEEVVNVLKEAGAYDDSQDSDEEENMMEDCYDDIKINGTSIQQ